MGFLPTCGSFLAVLQFRVRITSEMIAVKNIVRSCLKHYPIDNKPTTSYYYVTAVHPKLDSEILIGKQFTCRYLSELSICMYRNIKIKLQNTYSILTLCDGKESLRLKINPRCLHELVW